MVKGLRVVRPGIRSELQDWGRYGFAPQGMSQGGPIDVHAYAWANKLLENRMEAPLIELTVGRATFQAEQELCLALTGADMQARLDACPIEHWRTFRMKPGQILTLGAARDGMRAYLAVRGGFQVPSSQESVSTVARNRMGGLEGDGRSLQAGDRLPCLSDHGSKCGSAGHGLASLGNVRVPPRMIPEYRQSVCLRVVESYQSSLFSSSEMDAFYRQTYSLSALGDRMGARLEGAEIRVPSSGVISEGLALGSVQIPPDGQPIILLNDRQTLGGYPKLGCVARVDLPKLAQLRPGAQVSFVPVALEDARAAWLGFCRFFVR